MPLKASIFVMFALVFSCATTSTLPNASLLPVWSPWVCVVMMVVTGLFVTDFTLSSSVGPQPANLVSTSVTPASVMNTATLPPLNDSRGVGLELVIT